MATVATSGTSVLNKCLIDVEPDVAMFTACTIRLYRPRPCGARARTGKLGRAQRIQSGCHSARHGPDLRLLFMVNLAEYEDLGDLDAPFALSAKHHYVQREGERLREAVRCNIPPLPYDEYSSGAPCPGCGRPYRGEEPWEFRGTMHLGEEERARYESEEQRYRAAHGGCGSYRHRVSGSLTAHCGKCCPPPPLSPASIERLGQILGGPTRPDELMRWRLRLYCGHVVERLAHYTHKTTRAAFTGSVTCPECGLDPASIVDGVVLGLADEQSAGKSALSVVRRKPTRSQLEARVRELEAEVERLRQR